MDNEIDWHVWARHLAGTCSPEEERLVEAWLDADPTRRQVLRELQMLWRASADTPPPLDDEVMEADWNRLAEAMDASEASVSPSSERARVDRAPHHQRPHRSTQTSTLNRTLYVLLAGLLLVGSLWLGRDAWSPESSTADERVVVAERGERANIQLVDGTNVTMNVDSRLRIPIAFKEDTRTVHLEGEAYFDVAPDSARPFIVHTADAVIDVHGTAFNVRSYPEDRRVQVAVVEGAVSLRAQQSPPDRSGAQLRPGQVGRLDAREQQVTTHTANDVSAFLGWMEGRLVFDDATLDEVAARLARWYNLQFDIADPALDSLRLTANLKSRSIHNVLDVIAASLDIQYRIDNNTVVLADNGRRPSTR